MCVQAVARLQDFKMFQDPVQTVWAESHGSANAMRAFQKGTWGHSLFLPYKEAESSPHMGFTLRNWKVSQV